ncbi:KH domain-containing protein [Panicum miliaceum]|uniref:KH domain-containing protein n=1 Tax=Panicum miliaceum TaxID=4540 RepID=A0A3L6RLD6_PANMI|nr:KH domain-containing protein [Panicum miliaceum]
MSSGGRYMAYSPSPSTGPHSPRLPLADQEKYIAELLAEKQKLAPFMQVLPCTSRLLNQEILHVSALLGIPVLDQPGYQHGSPLINGGAIPNGRPVEMNGWAPAIPSEGAGMFHPPSRNWLSPQGNSGFIVKKAMRMDIPVDKYPNFNFVGRLLGPRGNSLKRVEANTDCRVLIRGRGSIKDASKLMLPKYLVFGISSRYCYTAFYLIVEEDLMRGKPGYEHLNEPLHLVIEAELPAEIIDIRLMQAREILDDMLKPVDESMDFFKKQQLRELAMLNGTLRDDSSQKSGSVSPFRNSLGMKRAKTRG